MSACLKTEELRWGSPTATTPFATLNFAPKVGLNEIIPFSEFNGQFDGFGWLTAGKLTDRTEGALTKPHIYTVAHASGSERSVLFPCLCFCLFRVFPCSSVAMLLLGLLSVAMLLLSFKHWFI